MDFPDPQWLTESNFPSAELYHKAKRYFFINLAAIYASRIGAKSRLGLAAGLRGARSLDTMASVGDAVSVRVAIEIERLTGGVVRAEDIRSGLPMPPRRVCGVCFDSDLIEQGCPDCRGIRNTPQEDEALV